MKFKVGSLFFLVIFASLSCYAQTYSILPFLSGEKYGLANPEGQLLVPPKYDEVITIPDCPLALFRQAGLWGIIDSKGNELIKPIIKGEPSTQKSPFAGVVMYPAFRKFFITDPDDFFNVTLYCIEDPVARKMYFINPAFPQAHYIAFLDSKVNPAGKEMILPSRSETGIITVVTPDTLINFIDTTGRLIFSKGWKWGKVLSRNVISIKNDNGKIQLYNPTGQLLLPKEYDDAYATREDYLIGRNDLSTESREYDMLSSQGDILLENRQSRPPTLEHDLIIDYDSTSVNLRDTSFRMIASFPDARLVQYSTVRNQIGLSVNNKFGLIDRNGKILFPPKYDRLQPASSDLFYFKLKTMSGLVKPNGHEIWSRDSVDVDISTVFPSGYFRLRKNTGSTILYGFIDSTGHVLVDPVYQDCSYREIWNCFTLISPDSMAVVNLKGEYVFPMTRDAHFEGNQMAISLPGEIIYYGRDFAFIARKPDLSSEVTIKKGGYNHSFLFNSNGVRLTDDRYVSLDRANDLVTGKTIFLGFFKETKDSIHIFNDQGKRIEPAGYVFATRYVQDAPDDAAPLLVTNREDLRKGKRNPRRGFIDGTGKWIMDPDTFDIWAIGKKILIRQDRQETKVKMYDMSGRFIHDRPYHYFIRRADDGIDNERMIVGFNPKDVKYTAYLEKNNLQDLKKHLASLAAQNKLPNYMKGCIDLRGNEIWPVKFLEMGSFRYAYTCAKEISESGNVESLIITKDGKEILRTDHELLYINNVDSTLVHFARNNKHGLMDLKGNVLIDPLYNRIDISSVNPKIVICQDSSFAYVVMLDGTNRQVKIGPAKYPKLERLGVKWFKTEINTTDQNTGLKYIDVFDEKGNPLSHVEAHDVEVYYLKQLLPDGYFSIQDKPGDKFYIMNYVTGKKYKAEK
ncbi:MAG TPA: WG repeat-containing protein [Saprospiraceae bacterium]|nr:WG repeat-containing protein [Saprospiraceae bacterium]